MITKMLFWKGVRHIFSPLPVSKFELVGIINNIYNLNIKINEYETDKDVNKTLTTIFDTNSIFQLPDIKEQIIEMKKYTL